MRSSCPRSPRALRVRPSSGCSVVTQPRTGSSLRDTHRGRIISDRACGIDIGWITRRRYGSARRPFPLEPGSLPPGRSPQDPGGRPAQSPAHADGLAIHDDGQGAVRDRSATGVRTRRPQMGRAGPPRPPLRRSRYTRLTAKTTPPQSSSRRPQRRARRRARQRCRLDHLWIDSAVLANIIVGKLCGKHQRSRHGSGLGTAAV